MINSAKIRTEENNNNKLANIGKKIKHIGYCFNCEMVDLHVCLLKGEVKNILPKHIFKKYVYKVKQFKNFKWNITLQTSVNEKTAEVLHYYHKKLIPWSNSIKEEKDGH